MWPYLEIVFPNLIKLRCLKWDDSGFQVGLKVNDWRSFKKRERSDTQRHRAEGPVKMEAEIGDVHRWAKEHQGLWAATRNWTGGTRDSPSRPPERTNPASVFISGFQPLNSKRIPICVKQSSLWWFVVAALESDTPQLVFSVVLTLEVWCQKLKLPPACRKAFLLSQYTLSSKLYLAVPRVPEMHVQHRIHLPTALICSFHITLPFPGAHPVPGRQLRHLL